MHNEFLQSEAYKRWYKDTYLKEMPICIGNLIKVFIQWLRDNDKLKDNQKQTNLTGGNKTK
jgi:hypothetical protein